MKNKALLLIVSFSLSSCCWLLGDCNDDLLPDLTVPEYINGTVFLGRENRYTVVAGNDYPNGTDLFMTNGKNEFFSVVRYVPNTGQPIVFYWKEFFPPPFYVGGVYPNSPLTIGETVYVHRCVYNNSNNIEVPESSNTKMEVIVKYENGNIVQTIEQQEKISETQKIAPNSYKIVTFPFKLNNYGNYDFKYSANFDNKIEESDYNNNSLNQNYTEDIGF